MVINEFIQANISNLENVSGNPRRELEEMVAHVVGQSRSFVSAHGDSVLNQSELSELNNFVDRRKTHEPLAYIVGVKEFYGEEYSLSPHVLIPRQETEELVEWGIETIKDHSLPGANKNEIVVCDVGTGSGVIVVSLAKYFEKSRGGISFLATDISLPALEVAQKNVRTIAANAPITFIQSDLLKNVNGPIDLIISNPPYIPTKRLHTLDPQVKNHEPITALDGGKDGLLIIKKLVKQGITKLRTKGIMLIEIDESQATDLKRWIERQYPDLHLEIRKDLAGKDRFARISY